MTQPLQLQITGSDRFPTVEAALAAADLITVPLIVAQIRAGLKAGKYQEIDGRIVKCDNLDKKS
jgi:hypothetical protein